MGVNANNMTEIPGAKGGDYVMLRGTVKDPREEFQEKQRKQSLEKTGIFF